LNAIEIEEAISALAERPFDLDEFPFEFLQAFGHKETTIKKLRKGTTNKSDLEGVLNNHATNIHIVVCEEGKVAETLDPSLMGKITTFLFEGDEHIKTPLLPIGLQIGFENRKCVMYPTSSYDYCDKHLKLRQIKNQCLATPEFPRYTFTFDTNDLTTGNKVNVEFSAETCGGTYENRVLCQVWKYRFK